MSTKMNSGDQKTWSFTWRITFILLGFCFSYTSGTNLMSGFGNREIAPEMAINYVNNNTFYGLNSESHQAGTSTYSNLEVKDFKPCDDRYIHYTPCQDIERSRRFPRESRIWLERHCPAKEQMLHCLIPAPKGYTAPFPWPKCRDHIHYENLKYGMMVRDDNMLNFVDERLRFPCGTDVYIDQLARVIPLNDGVVRTALDIGCCGVGSWGAYMFNKSVIAMSFSPADGTVQFALERGVPAVIGVLGTLKLPYPSRAFDMVHCSSCLIPWSEWSAKDGMYMMEVDRVLRPGGYLVLVSPTYGRNKLPMQRHIYEELEVKKRKFEEIPKLLCWEKKYEYGPIAIWRKRINMEYCHERDSRVPMCESTNVNDVWYKKMEPCISPYPETSGSEEVAGGELQPFPERMNAVPPRISSGSIPGTSVESFVEDNDLWKKHLNTYEGIIGVIDSGRYRNIMDMNAGLGSFSAALESPKLWVMNVMPTIAEIDTLGVIYERGLIGIYHDWCEAFSTNPRTYDLIHANGVFSLYKDKCNVEAILLEMDRILRPGGVVIFRDEVDLLIKMKNIVAGMRWNTTMVDHEYSPLVREKILFAFKQYWVADESNSTSLPVPKRALPKFGRRFYKMYWF